MTSQYRNALKETCTAIGISDLHIITNKGCLNEVYQASFKKHLIGRQKHEQGQTGDQGRHATVENTDEVENTDDDDPVSDQESIDQDNNAHIENVNEDRCVEIMTKLLKNKSNLKKYKKGTNLIQGLTRVRRNKQFSNRSKLGSFRNMKKFLKLEDPKMKHFKYLAMAKSGSDNNEIQGGRMNLRSSAKSQAAHTKQVDTESQPTATNDVTVRNPSPIPSPSRASPDSKTKASPNSETKAEDGAENQEFEIKAGALIIFGIFK